MIVDVFTTPKDRARLKLLNDDLDGTRGGLSNMSYLKYLAKGTTSILHLIVRGPASTSVLAGKQCQPTRPHTTLLGISHPSKDWSRHPLGIQS